MTDQMNEQGTPVDTSAAQTTPEADTPKKRARRVPVLVLGTWAGDVFTSTKLQPSGAAAKDVDKLQTWLREPQVAKALLEEGVTSVECVRKTLVSARYETEMVVRAKVSR